MEAQVKLNPHRLRVPQKGNGLMLLMEIAAGKNDHPITGSFLGKVTEEVDGYFDIEIKGSRSVLQGYKSYINNNL